MNDKTTELIERLREIGISVDSDMALRLIKAAPLLLDALKPIDEKTRKQEESK